MTQEKQNLNDIIKKEPLFAYCGLFVLALSLRLWFAFFDGHSVIFNACDASEYITSAKSIQDFLDKPFQFWIDSLKYLVGALTPEAMSAVQYKYGALTEISNRSGPIYPLFLFFSFSIFQLEANSSNLFAPVLVQCFVTALTCVLITFLGKKLWNKNIGLIAGVLASIYPGFIINSSRLVSESLACFWFTLALSLTVKMIVDNKGSSVQAVLLGISLGMMQLLRSAMLLVSGTFLLAGLIFNKIPHAKKVILITVLSIGIPLGSFACFQYLVNGTPSIVVDRLGSYNLFTGLDIDGHGWLTFPYPNYGLMENKGYFEIIKSKFDHDPKRFIELLFDKPPRLLAYHWNDFKTPIGFIGQTAQVSFHQLYLLLASIGICLGLFFTKEKTAFSKNIIGARCLVIATFIIQFSYCAFITLPRYALTSIPCIILFSAAGVYLVISKLQEKDKRKSAILLISSLVALLAALPIDLIGIVLGISPFKHALAGLGVQIAFKALFVCLFLTVLYKMTASVEQYKKATKFTTLTIAALTIIFTVPPLYAFGNVFEWHAPLTSKTQSLEQEIVIPTKAKLESSSFYLIVDSKDWQNIAQSARIFINEKEVVKPIIPLMPLVQYNKTGTQKSNQKLSYDLESITDSITLALGGTNLDLRQWFMLPIDKQILEESRGKLNIKLQPNKNHEALFYGNYITRRNQAMLPGLLRYSFEKAFYGIENKAGLSDIRYLDKVGIEHLENRSKDLSNSAGLQTGTYNIRVLEIANSHFGKPLYSKDNDEIHLPKNGLTSSINLENMNLSNSNEVHFATITADIESRISETVSLPVTVKAEFCSTLDSKVIHNYSSPWTPSNIILSPGANHIKLSFPFKPSDLGGNTVSVKISISPNFRKNENQFFTIKNSSELAKQVETNSSWSNIQLDVSKIESLPGLSSYSIY